jgi:hypothetical protein
MMFDPAFDPLKLLQDMSRQVSEQAKLHQQITQALIQHRDTIEELITQLNANTEETQKINVNVKDIHDRLRLLEVARQYEQTNKN